MTTARAHKPLIAAAGLILALSLGGCLSVDPFSPDTDPQSAADAAIAEQTARNLPYPRWSRFPAEPTGLVGPDQVRQDVARLDARGDDLFGWARANPPMMSDTAGWAAGARDDIDPRLARPAPPDARAQAEAFAARLRAEAVPPPIAK